MSSAIIPVWIIGGPFLGLLLLSFLFQGGTSAASDRSVDQDLPWQRNASDSMVPPFSDRDGHSQYSEPPRFAESEAIARLSGRKPAGAIAPLSAPRPFPVGAHGPVPHPA